MHSMSSSLLAQFIVTCVLIELTPGPNMGYLAIVSATRGRSAGIATVAGVALGLLIIGVAAALGLAAIIAASPVLYGAMRWGGVIYLLWLAWEGWVESDDPEAVSAEATKDHSKFFIRGLITNLLNPKAGVFYVAMIPTFVDQTRPVLGQTLTLSVAFVLIATAIHTSIVMLAGSAQWLLNSPRRSMIVRRVLSVTLAGIAVWFAWSTRQ